MGQRVDWSVRGETVMAAMISWILASLAIGFQILSIAVSIRSPRASQIYAVPVILWYPALMLRGHGFFLGSTGKEILLVVAIHVVLSFAALMISRIRLRM